MVVGKKYILGKKQPYNIRREKQSDFAKWNQIIPKNVVTENLNKHWREEQSDFGERYLIIPKKSEAEKIKYTTREIIITKNI